MDGDHTESGIAGAPSSRSGSSIDRDGAPVGAGIGVSVADDGGSGYYVDEGGDEEEYDGFAVTMNTQALSSLPTAATTSTSARPVRSAPQAMHSFDATGHPGASSQPSAGSQNLGVSAKVSASLTPLTTLGSSTRVSLPPNPHIGGLLTQSDEARYYALLQASAMENYPDKPWTREGADPSDYFNYGFTEETWTLYRERQFALRKENGVFFPTQDVPTHAARGSQNRTRFPTSRDGSSPSTSSHPDTRYEGGGRGARGDERRAIGRRDDDEDRRGGDYVERSGDRSERPERSDKGDREYRSEDRRPIGGREARDKDEPRSGGGRRETSVRYDDSSNKKRVRSPDTRDARNEDYRKKPRR